MQHLFKQWHKLEKIFTHKFIFLFFDFDGTLAPIADTPAAAVIPPGAKQLLGKLSARNNFKLAVISGRALSDIKRIIGIKAIVYAGNHGLEIEGPKIKHTMFVQPRYPAILKKIKEELGKKLKNIKGIYLEDKGLSLSLHYRLASKKDTGLIKTIFYETTIVYAIRNKIKATRGKMVLEVRPAFNWDKGSVVLWLLARWKFALKNKDVFPVYIGDDATDEDAFKAIKNRGIAVFVGRPRGSCAQYYLKNPKEVIKFLKAILAVKERV